MTLSAVKADVRAAQSPPCNLPSVHPADAQEQATAWGTLRSFQSDRLSGDLCQKQAFWVVDPNTRIWSSDVEPEPTLACHGRALPHIEALCRSIPLGSLPLESDYPEADGEHFYGAE